MSVRTHMWSGSIQVPVRAELDLAAPEHGGACSGAACALPQETREGKNPTKPHPSRPPAEAVTTAQTHTRE